MLRIVFIEQFYYPEGWGGAQLPRDVTTYLSQSGCEVEVICGADQYVVPDSGPSDDPRDAGVRITKIPRILRGDIQTLKLLRQLWFYFAVVPLLLFRRSPHLFVAQTNPPLVVPLVALTALIHRRPFVVIAQDLYPEVIFAHGSIEPRSVLGRMLSRLFRWAYERAHTVVSLGPTMSERLIEKGVSPESIEIISNWSTGSEEIVRGADNYFHGEWGLNGSFVVLYSGNLGISHDVETPILAIRDVLREVPEIKLVFIGKGSRLSEAKKLAAELGVESAVQFRSFVASNLLSHSFGLADLALVTLRESFQGLVVPSKSLGYMARGIPILYVGPPSDIQQLVEISGSGLCVENADVPAMAAALLSAVRDRKELSRMGDRGRRYYQQELTRTRGLERYRALLTGVARLSQVAD